MKTKVILRSDWKKWLKSPGFYEVFPEYEELKKEPIPCCRMPKEQLSRFTKLILDNPQKWKNFLGVDRIQIFYERSLII